MRKATAFRDYREFASEVLRCGAGPLSSPIEDIAEDLYHNQYDSEFDNMWDATDTNDD